MEESVAGCTAGLVDRAHRGGTRTHLSMGDIRVNAFRNGGKRKRYCAKRAIFFEASDDPRRLSGSFCAIETIEAMQKHLLGYRDKPEGRSRNRHPDCREDRG